MKASVLSSCLVALLAAALLRATSAGSVHAAEVTTQVIPLIAMDSVQLTDAIKNLARQAGLNFILDPRLFDPAFGPDGKVIPTPLVTARYENMPAMEALLALLKKHDLQLVEYPVTKVARITRIGQTTRPVDPAWVAGDTNGVIPLIMMESAPLDVAIQQLAGKAQLKVVVDPALSRPSFVPGGRPVSPPMVSIRWENITTRQAIAALVENYDLSLNVNAESGVVSISPRRPADANPTPLNKPGGPGK